MAADSLPGPRSFFQTTLPVFQFKAQGKTVVMTDTSIDVVAQSHHAAVMILKGGCLEKV